MKSPVDVGDFLGLSHRGYQGAISFLYNTTGDELVIVKEHSIRSVERRLRGKGVAKKALQTETGSNFDYREFNKFFEAFAGDELQKKLGGESDVFLARLLEFALEQGAFFSRFPSGSQSPTFESLNKQMLLIYWRHVAVEVLKAYVKPPIGIDRERLMRAIVIVMTFDKFSDELYRTALPLHQILGSSTSRGHVAGVTCPICRCNSEHTVREAQSGVLCPCGAKLVLKDRLIVVVESTDKPELHTT